MADQRDRGGPTPGSNNTPTAASPESGGGTTTNDNAAQRSDRDLDRDRQNRDDPSRAPESGDRK